MGLIRGGVVRVVVVIVVIGDEVIGSHGRGMGVVYRVVRCHVGCIAYLA